MSEGSEVTNVTCKYCKFKLKIKLIHGFGYYCHYCRNKIEGGLKHEE